MTQGDSDGDGKSEVLYDATIVSPNISILAERSQTDFERLFPPGTRDADQ